ncbi:hypothetical protein O181_062251, partial [Austropuccinia psidii MF-1]|nr:hypothetical protein [Austropuccinia psidii MF-1]
MVHTQILTPVQGPKGSHTNPYAFIGSRQFTCKFLYLNSIPEGHTQIPTLVQVHNSSHPNPYTCPGSQLFTHNLLGMTRLPMVTQFL